MQVEAKQMPINILILTELKKQQSVELSKEALSYLRNQNNFNLYTEDNIIFNGTILYNSQTQIHYVISIGQNSTMMRALRLLNHRSSTLSTIPIISISDGEQPIMSSYSNCQIHHVLQNFIKGVKLNNLRIMNTIQFQSRIRHENSKKNFSCELEIHRDMSKSVLRLKIYARIEGKNFLHLANVWGDGIIISTPLGSLGRNINLSGPIVYKSLDSIIIVPISPLSLNFRPIILPSNAEIIVQVEEESRSPAQVFADGQLIFNSVPGGKQIQLKSSELTSKLVVGLSQKSTQQQWISCLRDVLSWGEAFGSQKNKAELNKNGNQNSKL